MSKQRVAVLAGLVSLSCFVSQLRGTETHDYWDLKYAGIYGTSVSISYKASPSASYTTRSVVAGLDKFDPGSDTYHSTELNQTFPVQGTAFWTYCTDVGVSLYTSQSGDEGNGWDYRPTSFVNQDGVNPAWRTGGASEAAYIYNMLVTGYASVNPGPGQTKIWGSLTFDPLNANTEYAAAQVAIWEVLYDSTYNLTSGMFKLNTTGTILTYAQAILAQLQYDKSHGLFQTYYTTWLQPMYNNGTEGGSQGLLYPPVPWPPPEPPGPPSTPDGGMTLVLLGVAVGSLVMVGRKVRA